MKSLDCAREDNDNRKFNFLQYNYLLVNCLKICPLSPA